MKLLLGVLVIAAGMPLGWGLALPAWLLLDPLASELAARAGAVAGFVAFALVALLTWLRIRSGVEARLAFQTGRDLGMLAAVVPLAQWALVRSDARLPYVESLSVLVIQISVGLTIALAAYVWVRYQARVHGARPGGVLPGIPAVFLASTAVLGMFTAVVLGVGSAARSAGALDRRQATSLEQLADLFAAALTEASDPERRRLLDLLTLEPDIRAQLLPPGKTPPNLRDAPEAAHGGRLTALVEGGRLHIARRPIGDAVLWLTSPGNVRPPVRAPDDAPALLILALLVLGAPAAAFFMGRDLSAQLVRITRALRAMAPTGDDREAIEEPTPGVPVASNDEIGDLAAELNATCVRFAEQGWQYAEDLAMATANDRARTQFLATASHELRTPLTSIIGYCHLLQRRGSLNAAQQEDIAEVARGSDQLLSHVDDILALSKIELGKELTLELELVDVVEIATSVLGARRTRLPAEVTADITAASGLPRVRGDRRRLRQVIENLVDNAVKFTREGFVQVTVGASELEGRPAVHLQVADSGPGIPEADLEQVFTEFHRVASQRDVAGTGLGLAIARRLVERHGGRIWAESVLGEGSVFHLLLPAVGR